MYIYHSCRIYCDCGNRACAVCFFDSLSVVLENQKNFSQSIAYRRIKAFCGLYIKGRHRDIKRFDLKIAGAHSTACPLSQKVPLRFPVPLQASSRWFTVAANFLRDMRGLHTITTFYGKNKKCKGKNLEQSLTLLN